MRLSTLVCLCLPDAGLGLTVRAELVVAGLEVAAQGDVRSPGEEQAGAAG